MVSVIAPMLSAVRMLPRVSLPLPTSTALVCESKTVPIEEGQWLIHILDASATAAASTSAGGAATKSGAGK